MRRTDKTDKKERRPRIGSSPALRPRPASSVIRELKRKEELLRASYRFIEQLLHRWHKAKAGRRAGGKATAEKRKQSAAHRARMIEQRSQDLLAKGLPRHRLSGRIARDLELSRKTVLKHLHLLRSQKTPESR